MIHNPTSIYTFMYAQYFKHPQAVTPPRFPCNTSLLNRRHSVSVLQHTGYLTKCLQNLRALFMPASCSMNFNALT